MSPSVAALPLFFAARAWPLSLRTFLAPSTSPSDSSSARFTSIIPAAVSSRSCLIFSIVPAKAPTSPQSFRSPRPAPPLPQAQSLLTLLSRVLPPEALQPPQVRRPPHRWLQPRQLQARTQLRPVLPPLVPLRSRTHPRYPPRARLHVLAWLLVRPLLALQGPRSARRWDRRPPLFALPRRSPGSLRPRAAQGVARPALPPPCQR